jgi:hypothetical protein
MMNDDFFVVGRERLFEFLCRGERRQLKLKQSRSRRAFFYLCRVPDRVMVNAKWFWRLKFYHPLKTGVFQSIKSSKSL